MSTAVRYKINREDQMAIVNTAFMKIIDSIEQFQVGSNYFSWAKRIVSNTVIDDFRRNKKYKELFNVEADESEVLIERDDMPLAYKEMEVEKVQQVLDQLPPATKITFNLFAIDGYSYKEIAKELNIGYETVKWHVKEARKKLKLILNKNGEFIKH
jgi:RNA polymerase sigma-70 factor (ECF subfamily)